MWITSCSEVSKSSYSDVTPVCKVGPSEEELSHGYPMR